MPSWFTFPRTQDGVAATVSVNYGIDVPRELPARPLLFLIVRTVQPTSDEPTGFEASIVQDLEAAGTMLVGAITMGVTRTLLAYGPDETKTRQALGAYDGALAFQSQSDPEWQIYRTLLPSEDEVALVGGSETNDSL